VGAAGEAAVAARYVDSGYTVLTRNWRCDEGELDLVVADPDGRTIVFCEVKTRRSGAFGSPLEAVTRGKQRRVRRLATRWLAAHRAIPAERRRQLRFDVGAVEMNGERVTRLEIVEAAF
jgi:putative endonuclease